MPVMDGVESTAAIRQWERVQMKEWEEAAKQQHDKIVVEMVTTRHGGVNIHIGFASACHHPPPLPPSSVYIVALTADAVPGARERYLACGMDAYLSKPLRPQEVEPPLPIHSKENSSLALCTVERCPAALCLTNLSSTALLNYPRYFPHFLHT